MTASPDRVASRTSTEDHSGTQALLTDIFEELLDRAPVHPDENFFDLGGSSVLAISLILEIERMTGHQLPVAAIYDAPTVRSMAALLADQVLPAFSPLISLREGTTPACLFLVHGLGGSAIELRQLARQINVEFSVYGIQAFGLCNEAPHDSVDAMAAAYVEEILRVQPSGPYILAGYSFGGLVAFEMTRLLERRGSEVRFLGLIDSYPDNGMTIGRLASRLAMIMRAPAEERGAVSTRIRQNLSFRLRKRLGLSLPPPPDEPGTPQAVVDVNLMNKVALYGYRPARLAREVVFFQPSSPIEILPTDPRPIWRRLVGTLTIEKIPGDHYSLMRAHVGSLAAALNKSLEAALAHA